MRFSRTLLVFTATGIIGTISSCRDVVAPPPVAAISLSGNAVELVPSETVQITASPKDAAGNPLTRPLTWSTTAASIATVENGLITAKGPGTASVSVESEGIRAVVGVSVKDGGIATPAGAQISALGGLVELDVASASVSQPSKITISQAQVQTSNTRLIPGTAVALTFQGQLGQAATLAIHYDPNRILGSPETGLRLFESTAGGWKPIAGSSVDIATKTVQGKINEGGAYAIFAQANIVSVTVSPAAPSLRVGESAVFSAGILDEDGAPVTDRKPTWTSSAPEVLEIDPASGAAKAKAPGAATITATLEGKSGAATASISAGAAASISIVSGDGQTADTSTVLATPPSVKVTDASGFPVSGVAVAFSVTSGGGSVSPASVTTNGDGIAAADRWQLGSVAGANSVTATIPSGASVTFTATATQPPPPAPTPAPTPAPAPAPPPPPAPAPAPAPTLVPVAIAIFAGDNQTAQPLTAVAIRPAVKVSAANGTGVPGVTVTFSIRSGGGSVTGATAVSDSAGIATVGSWVLGSGGGNSLFAAASGLSGSPLIFIATASSSSTSTTTTSTPPTSSPPGQTAGPPVAMAIYAGDGQNVKAFTAVPVAPAVKVTDAAGVGVAGVIVTFSVRSGGGTISGENATTDAQGIARLGQWVMGPPGGQSLFATKAGLTGSPLIFIATSQAGVRIVTFGDSNTDGGWNSSNVLVATSYVSSDGPRAPPGQNNSTQLAGKIEAQWRAVSAVTITAVNHGISGTTSGAGRTTLTAPNSREAVNGVTRFEAEVLGNGFPWSGGETGTTYPYGPITRTAAYIPGVNDFVYVSIGTNDPMPPDLLTADQTAANLNWMIDQWVGSGHQLDHFIITTLAPRPSVCPSIQLINQQIRQIVVNRPGIYMIDLAQRTTASDGCGWLSSLDNVGDQLHYSEPVRDWIASQVVAYLLTKAPK